MIETKWGTRDVHVQVRVLTAPRRNESVLRRYSLRKSVPLHRLMRFLEAQNSTCGRSDEPRLFIQRTRTLPSQLERDQVLQSDSLACTFPCI